MAEIRNGRKRVGEEEGAEEIAAADTLILSRPDFTG